MTTIQEEAEAAELEGFIAIDSDPAAMGLVWAFKTQRRIAKAAADAKGKLGNKIMEYIEAHGAKVITIGGQVFARKQIVQARTVFDEDRFKADHPQMHKNYMTKEVAGSTRLWVRPQDGDDPE